MPISGLEAFTEGQLVDVIDYGLATVVSSNPTDPRFQGRVQVRYQDGATYWANTTKVRPLHPSHKRVVACPTTRQYRIAWIQNVTPQDVCLEIGCHEGVTTALLHKRVQYVVGVDMSAVTVEAARQSHPQCRFEVCDGFDMAKLRTFSPRADGGYSVIGVDIGGIAELPKVLSLVHALLGHFKASVQFPVRPKIIVKSVQLCHFLEMTEQFRYDEPNHWALPLPVSGLPTLPATHASADPEDTAGAHRLQGLEIE